MEVPGNVIGDEIEFTAGEGAYSEDDYVKAALCGSKHADPEARSMGIRPAFGTPKKVEIGQELYGVVEDAGETSAAIRVHPVSPSGENIDVPNDYTMLRIEQAKVRGMFVKSMKDLLRIGDIVKVSVAKISSGALDVSIKRSELGVIKAFCSECRGPLALTGENRLFCSKCERHEVRKLGAPYLEVIR